MAENYDPVPDLAEMFTRVLLGGRDGAGAADRIAERLGLGEDDSPETVEKALRKTLGFPGPRTVTYDMSVTDAYSVLTTALEELAAEQRYRARNEGGNPRRHEWADLADAMRHQADTARGARGE